jgi:hypothetical protein
MKLCLIVVLSFIVSTTTFAYNICESTFVRSVHKEKVRAIYKRYKSLKISKINNLRSTTEKLQAIDETYSLIAKDYHAQKRMIRIEAKRYNNLEPKALSEKIKSLEHTLLKDNIENLNRLVNQSYDLLKKEGVGVELISREFMGIDNVLSIELKSLNQKRYSRSIDLLQRYKKKFGTQRVTFDFTENMFHNFAGFSHASAKRIDLGIQGIQNILVDDLVTMVAKHEFMHAAFAAKRAKGQISVYHAEYMSKGIENLSSVNSGYNKYMTAEEIHNWANNSFWASSRLSDISKYNKATFKADLQAIFNDIDRSKNIFQQGIEITEKTLESLNAQKSLILKNESTLVFSTPTKQIAKTADVADYVAIESIDESFIYFDFVGDPQSKKMVAKILNNRKKLDLKYSSFKNADGVMPEVKLLEFVAEDSKFSKVTSIKIIDDLISRQTKLNSFSKKALQARDETEQVAKEFVEMLQIKKSTNPDYLNTPEIIDSFRGFRKQLRKFGNSVKEGYHSN